MKILIIGGTKFIGKEIYKVSQNKGHEIYFFNRGKSEKKLNLNTITGDIENILDYKKELLELNPDIVIHCICFTEKHANDCVEIFKNKDTKVIILSSQDCYDAFQKLVRGIESSDYPIDENMKLTPIKYYWDDLGAVKIKGYDKNLVTDIFMEAFENDLLNVTVFRLPMVYGPNDYQFQHRHASIIRRIIDKQEKFVLSNTEQNKIWPFGYVENIASAIVFSFDKKITNGKIYNIGEKKSRSWRRWCELYAEILDWKFDFYILPDEIIENKTELKNSYPLHIMTDNTLFLRETGFEYPVNLKNAITKTYNYALDNVEVLGEKPDYNSEWLKVNKYLDLLKEFK